MSHQLRIGNTMTEGEESRQGIFRALMRTVGTLSVKASSLKIHHEGIKASN